MKRQLSLPLTHAQSCLYATISGNSIIIYNRFTYMTYRNTCLSNAVKSRSIYNYNLHVRQKTLLNIRVFHQIFLFINFKITCFPWTYRLTEEWK